MSVREIATRARAACEWFVAHEPTRTLDCHSQKTLEGLCAIASVFLAEVLKREGHWPVIVGESDHVWVWCGGYHIDITASQFGFEPVFIRRGKPYQGSIPDFREWPKGQRPTRARIKFLLSIY